MLNRVTLLFIIALLIPAVILPQTKTILRADGSLLKVNPGQEVLPVKGGKAQFEFKKVGPVVRMSPNNPQGLIDTLAYPQAGTASNFGIFGQDWLVQWFEAPADLSIKKVALAALAADVAGTSVQVKVVKGNWTADEYKAAGEKRWGYYPAAGNGFTNITAFTSNPDKTGDWVAINGTTEPWGEDLWGQDGGGWPLTPTPNGAEPVYEWVDLEAFGAPAVLKGEVFGIAVQNISAVLDGDRLGLWSYSPSNGFNGWKFYSTFRLVENPADGGWWSRAYVWDFAAEVDITGDIGPDINTVTEYVSGVDVGPFTIEANITDQNPGNPAQAGVASALLQYSYDDGATWTDVPMTGTAPDFTAQIPQTAPYTWVTYQVVATDLNSNTSTSIPSSFYIFAPREGNNTLFIFNGHGGVDATANDYPMSYYFGETMVPGETEKIAHDSWSYGPIPNVELLNHYTNIFEFWSGAGDYNDELIRQWLEADASRNYFLSGEEYLGAWNQYTNVAFAPGTFQYDILGVAQSYNDISYAGDEGNDQPTLVIPQAGTLFGDPLLTLFNSLTPAPDSLMYNPIFELGTDNWQDAFDAAPGVEVDMMVETRGVDNVASVMTKPTQVHRTLTAGNKIIFMSYDPLSLNTAVDGDYDYYNWVGFDQANTPYQALTWFGITVITDVREIGGTPTTFALSQNYPNPFNPATTINFSIPEVSKVTLKIYDVLGKEVSTLLNEEKSAGNYEVSFDASKLTSGVYFYSLSAGNTLITKKMMLMK